MTQITLLDEMDETALRFHMFGKHGYSIEQIARIEENDLVAEHTFATKRDKKAGVLLHGHDDDVD